MLPKIVIPNQPDAAMREAILAPLVRYNAEQVGEADYQPLAILLTDPLGAITGGLWGRTSYGFLFVELLAVPETHRHAGIGERILYEAEAIAIGRGCTGAWLDTFSFQARGFYEKLGYALFGEIVDYPPGHSRYFLQKRLESPTDADLLSNLPE